MKHKYIYAVFIESDNGDNERDRLFYECGYHYEWFTTLQKAKEYARKCRDEIKALMKKGEVVFGKNSTITMDVERYDNFDEEKGEEIDYGARQLVYALYLQGRY